MRPTCSRCGSADSSVVVREDCEECGPTSLCDECHEFHRGERETIAEHKEVAERLRREGRRSAVVIGQRAPCDWDGESYCSAEGCQLPATHSRFVGAVGEDEIVEMVCCSHGKQWW